jgi:hypothetical protein
VAAGRCWSEGGAGAWRCRWNGWGHVGTVRWGRGFRIGACYATFYRRLAFQHHFHLLFLHRMAAFHQTMAGSLNLQLALSGSYWYGNWDCCRWCSSWWYCWGGNECCNGARALGYRLVLCLRDHNSRRNHWRFSRTANENSIGIRTLRITTFIRSIRHILQSPFRPFHTRRREDLDGLLIDRYNDFSGAKAFTIG